MSVSKIANRYAKALIEQGEKNKTLDLIIDEVNAFILLLDNREFLMVLRSPIIKADQKQAIFSELFSGKINDQLFDFFTMVIKKGRETILPEILRVVLKKYKESKGVTTVTLTSAVDLSNEAFESISEKLKKTSLASENVEFIKKLDPSILGGFVIEIDDKLYDASIAGKLRRIKKEIVGK